MEDDHKKQPELQSTNPMLDEIRRAHQAESACTIAAIKNGRVEQLKLGGSIFQHDRTPEEIQEKERRRLEATTALRVVFKDL